MDEEKLIVFERAGGNQLFLLLFILRTVLS